MRRRLLTAMVIVGLLGSWSATSVDAAPAHALQLTGSRTASADLVLRQNTTFDVDKLAISGKGSFAGFYMESLDKPVAKRTEAGARLGAVTIRDWRTPDGPGLTTSFTPPGKQQLSAGRYRVYLVADGPTTVSLPTNGATMRLRPTRPATAAVEARADILSSPVQATNTQTMRFVGKRTVALVGLVVGRFRAYVGTIGSCFRTPEAECGEHGSGADGAFAGYLLSPLSDLDLSWTTLYEPGVLKPGRYEAHQEALNATTLQYASGAAFTLSLD
jgi:hypothetical protein